MSAPVLRPIAFAQNIMHSINLNSGLRSIIYERPHMAADMPKLILPLPLEIKNPVSETLSQVHQVVTEMIPFIELVWAFGIGALVGSGLTFWVMDRP
jgi:ABC-type nitrate/sulfonate/bicarbonate transport system permease component